MIDVSDPETCWEQFKVDLPDATAGNWQISHFSVTEMDPQRWHHKLKGRDTGVGDFTKLARWDAAKEGTFEDFGIEKGQEFWLPVMSDTRTEIVEHWPMIERLFQPGAKRVLIGALGLGMVTRAALLSPYVEHIDVVDLSPDVISMVAPHYTSPRLTVHHGDIFTWEPPTTETYDLGWYDPWDGINADNIPEMVALHERYNVRWSGCWSEPEALDAAQREVRFDEGTMTVADLANFIFDSKDIDLPDEELLPQR